LHWDDVARGIWDSNIWAPDLIFTDISQFVHGFSTSRTSNRVAGPVLRYEAGQLTADLNNTDRRFDPSNIPAASTPSVFAGGFTGGFVSTTTPATGQVTPMRIVRVRATWAGTTYNVWRGNADSWMPGYRLTDANSYASVTLAATDGFKILGRRKRAVSAPAGAGELSGARINRVLTSAGWPAGDRIIDPGQTTLQATTLEGDALAETQLVSDTEIGAFYIDGAGRAVFRDRHALFTDTRSNTTNAIFGDNLTTELPYVGIEPSYDDEQMVNEALITRAGGVQQVSSDDASVSQNFHADEELSDLLMQSDSVAKDYGGFIVYMSKDSEYRFESLTINPLSDPVDLFPQVLGREIGDRITVRRRPPGGGSLIEIDVLIVGINHDVDFRAGTWLTTWQLESATKFAFLTWDHATLGLWDENAWGF
jgi:hypothetical protein